jgi:hypothetical protein
VGVFSELSEVVAGHRLLQCGFVRYGGGNGWMRRSRLTMQLDLKLRVAENGTALVHEPGGGHAAIIGVELDADAIPAGFEDCNPGGAAAAEGINLKSS